MVSNSVKSHFEIEQFNFRDGRRHFHWRPRLIIERASDGNEFIASHPGHPISFGWYFRRVDRIAGRLYRETGDVWRVEDDIFGKQDRRKVMQSIMKLWAFRKGVEVRVPIAQALREYVWICKGFVSRSRQT